LLNPYPVSVITTDALPAQPGKPMLSKIKDLAFAYLQDGLPIVTTVTGALIGVNRTDSIYKVMGYGIVGWTVGYLGQAGFFKLVTGPGQKIPTEAGELAPKYASAPAAPPMPSIGLEPKTVQSQSAAPVQAVGDNVRTEPDNPYGASGFDPSSFGN